MSLVVAKKSRGRPPKKAYKEDEEPQAEPEPNMKEDETEKENIETKTPAKITDDNKKIVIINDKSENDADDGCKDEINNHSLATKSKPSEDDNDEVEDNDSHNESSNKIVRGKKSDITYKDDSESEEEENVSEENSGDDFDPKKAQPKKKSPIKKKGRGRPSVKKSAGRGRPPAGQGPPKKKKSSPVRYEYELSDSTDSEIDAGGKSDDTDDMNYRPYGEVRVKKRKVSKEYNISSESDGGDWKPGKAFLGQKKVTKEKKKKRLSEDGAAQKGRGRPPKESKVIGRPKEEEGNDQDINDSKDSKDAKDAIEDDEKKSNPNGNVDAPPTTLAPAKRRGRPKAANKSKDIKKKGQVPEGVEEDGATQEEE